MDDVPQFNLPTPEDELTGILRHAQRLLLRHPVAAQALFQGLVAEGRRYAETPEGARWRDALVGSDLIRRGRVVWEVGTLNILEEDPAVIVPSKILDALAKASSVPALEVLLTRLFRLGEDA